MANQLSLSGKAGLWRNLDLRKRLLFLLGALVVYRIGAHVPVPGVDAAALAKLFENQSAGGGILSIFNMFSGGAFQRFSVFAIGIMPYISASIIMQLAAEIIPSLKALKKEGDSGRKVITKYTRIGTVVLATIQSFGIATLALQQNIVVIPVTEFYLSTVFSLVGGTMFLMWLGEQITERGVGNGISLLITAGIIAAIPSSVVQLLDPGSIFLLIFLAFGALFLTYIVVFFECAQRKVPIHYARRQVGDRLVQGKNSYMPFKLNMAGVIPPIFASTIIMLPIFLLGFLSSKDSSGFLVELSGALQHGRPLYMILFTLAVVFFCYFYTALTFSPKEMSENLKKSGAFIPGIRPGANTAQYLERVVLRLTLFGAAYITIICLIPEFISSAIGNNQIYLGGTSLLILVVVAMDFSTQLSSYKLTQQYSGFIRDSRK